MKENLISKELKESTIYRFEMEGNLLALTQRNVALVEAMIVNDSDYRMAGDVNASPKGKYKGSTAYWMVQLKEVLKTTDSKKIRDTILEAVLAVDRENSTHITADSIGPEVLTERILKQKDSLIDILKNRARGFEFIQELSKRTSKIEKIVDNEKTYFPRENYSFATKFCHYACFFFFDNDADRKYQDNYSIYDGVVGKVLPYYLSAIGIKRADKKLYKKGDFDKAENYELYSNMIDLLRKDRISRNGFDHLPWYYHKARI